MLIDSKANRHRGKHVLNVLTLTLTQVTHTERLLDREVKLICLSLSASLCWTLGKSIFSMLCLRANIDTPGKHTIFFLKTATFKNSSKSRDFWKLHYVYKGEKEFEHCNFPSSDFRSLVVFFLFVWRISDSLTWLFLSITPIFINTQGCVNKVLFYSLVGALENLDPVTLLPHCCPLGEWLAYLQYE